MSESLLDLAYKVVLERHGKSGDEGQPISFKDLWKEIAAMAGYSEEEANSHVAYFYTNLILDNRFVSRGSNTWDLRQFYTLAEVNENTDFYNEEGLDDDSFIDDDEEQKNILSIDQIEQIVPDDETEPNEEIRLEDVDMNTF